MWRAMSIVSWTVRATGCATFTKILYAAEIAFVSVINLAVVLVAVDRLLLYTLDGGTRNVRDYILRFGNLVCQLHSRPCCCGWYG